VKYFIFVVFLLFAASGCVFVNHETPEDPLSFSKNISLSDLDGVYLNKGDPNLLLSYIITGYPPTTEETKNIDHSIISHIDVSVSGKHVTVKFISDNCYIYKRIYEEGSDFEISNDEIVIESEFHPFGADVFVGPVHEKTILGLGNEGDGVYRNKVTGGGLVALLFPTVIHTSSEVRFKKIGPSGNFAACKS